MNGYKIVCVGKIKEKYYCNKINEYMKEISGKYPIKIIELPDESIPKKASSNIIDGIKLKEGEKILHNISCEDYVIALCIEGKMTDTSSLKKVIYKGKERVNGDITFVIGGSLGLDLSVIQRADYKLSFSRMTFPHQMMRVMLLEQLNHL